MTSWMIISAEMGRFATQAQLRVPAFMIFDIGKFWQKSHLTEGFAFGSFHVAEMLCRWNVTGDFHKRRSFEPKENKWAGPVPLIGSINMEQLLIIKSFYTGLLTRCFFAVLYADIDWFACGLFFFFCMSARWIFLTTCCEFLVNCVGIAGCWGFDIFNLANGFWDTFIVGYDTLCFFVLIRLALLSAGAGSAIFWGGNLYMKWHCQFERCPLLEMSFTALSVCVISCCVWRAMITESSYLSLVPIIIITQGALGNLKSLAKNKK